MSDKWNKFFEKQALEDLKPPDSNVGEKSETETELAGENAEKELNEQKDENENESEQKGTENHEGSESEETGKETV